MIQGIALRNVIFSYEKNAHLLIDILNQIDFPIDELYKTESTISADQLGQFLELAVIKLRDLRIGLKIGLKSPFSTLGILGQLYQSCDTYSDALARMKSHINLLDAINEYDFEVHDDGIYHITRLQKEWSSKYPQGSRQFMEHNIGFSVRSRREYLGREIKPIRIETPYERIGEKDLLEDMYDCPIIFGAKDLCIVLPNKMLDWQIPTANPEALQMYEAYINRMHGIRNIWTEHTKQHIKQQIKNFAPTLSHIASLMNLSPRSLQRRLQEENTTFQEVLDDVRLEMIRHLLMQPQLSIYDISEALGFEIQNSLNRFIAKKIGKTPNEWRKEMLRK